MLGAWEILRAATDARPTATHTLSLSLSVNTSVTRLPIGLRAQAHLHFLSPPLVNLIRSLVLPVSQMGPDM